MAKAKAAPARRTRGAQSSGDPLLQKILDMLGDERLERRCAAAMVLGVLQPKDAAVGEALGAALGEAGPLASYALEALAALRPRKLPSYLSPLLDSPDEDLRLRVTELLTELGGAAVRELGQQLDVEGASTPRRKAIVRIIGAEHTAETFERLLALLGDAELGEVVRNTLRSELDRMDAPAQKQLREALLARLKRKTWLAQEVQAAQTVRLLGYFRDATLVAVFLPFAASGQPTLVRRAAIAALRRPLTESKSTAKALQVLLECASEQDSAIARAALDTLRGLSLGDEQAAALQALAAAHHAEVRAWAVERLGSLGGTTAVRVLIDRLDGDDPAARDAALRALRQMDDVGPALVKRLGEVLDDPAAVDRFVRLLSRHTDELKPAARRKITELALGAQDRAHPAAAVLLRLVATVDPEAYAQAIVERAQKHRKGKRYAEAFEALLQLDEADLLTEEPRYLALVCGLLCTEDKKALARAPRGSHVVLRQATRLVATGFALASKLRKERSLEPEHLFYVGFNLIESKDDDERELGATLLEQLASAGPRSKLGKSAKNKLKLCGLD